MAIGLVDSLRTHLFAARACFYFNKEYEAIKRVRQRLDRLFAKVGIIGPNFQTLFLEDPVFALLLLHLPHVLSLLFLFFSFFFSLSFYSFIPWSEESGFSLGVIGKRT